MYSLNEEVIDRLLKTTLPSFQVTHTDTRNLGFGHLFYGFARTLRPKLAVAIGSKAGFAPLCFALGMKDNEGHGIGEMICEETYLKQPGETPQLHFIDPSYNFFTNDSSHWYGIGTWDDPENVKKLWASFGVKEIVTHFKMTSQEYLAKADKKNKIDLLYIDGDHSYEGITHDFVKFHEFLSEGAMVLSHDVDPEFEKTYQGGGYRAFCDLPNELYERTRIPIYPGLAIARKKEIKTKCAL